MEIVKGILQGFSGECLLTSSSSLDRQKVEVSFEIIVINKLRKCCKCSNESEIFPEKTPQVLNSVIFLY